MTSVLPLVMHRYKVIQEVPKIPKTEVIHNDSYLKNKYRTTFGLFTTYSIFKYLNDQSTSRNRNLKSPVKTAR